MKSRKRNFNQLSSDDHNQAFDGSDDNEVHVDYEPNESAYHNNDGDEDNDYDSDYDNRYERHDYDDDNDDNDGRDDQTNGDNADSGVHYKPTIKKSKSSNNKIPTNEELNNLKETESLFHSSLFRFQLEEMLSEVKLKQKYYSKINNWFKQFEAILKSLVSTESRHISDQLWLKAKVPIIQEPFEVKGMFRFEAPKQVRLIGSYDTKTAIRSQIVIDIAVEMPAICWQKQDFANHRYHRKRALYLCCIAQMIERNEIISEINYSYLNGNHMKPILLIKPNHKIAKYCTFSLLVYPESNVFRAKRFEPEKSNVRVNWFQSCGDEDCATPVYNSSVLNDINLISNYEYLFNTIQDSDVIKDSLIIIKVWLKQRGLKSSFSFILSMFVCYLLNNRKISKNSSCYQVFRSTLLAIMNSKWDSEGIRLCKSMSDEPPFQQFFNYYSIVFLDVSGYHNLCWDITIDLYERLKHESKLTIDCLDSNERNSFESTFMRTIEFECKFDALLHVSVPSLLTCNKLNELNKDVINYSGNIVKVFVIYLIKLLTRALNERISLIQHNIVNQVNEWSINELPPHPNDCDLITFGIVINSENAFNCVDRGPDAESSDAKEFRDFWGDKSELRRFQDAIICEAVYWPAKSFADKRTIISRSIKHILYHNLRIPAKCVSITLSKLDRILKLSNIEFKEEDSFYDTGEEASLAVIHSFDVLAKRLRSVENIPLSVSSVQGISCVFRGTDVFPPLPRNSGNSNFVDNSNIFDLSNEKRVPKYFKPLEVIIHLEGSGKWPNDYDALKRVKASFNIEISKQLWSQFGLVTYACSDYVDVFQDGYIFRIIVACHKELVLLRQIKTSEHIIKSIHSETADRLERKTELLPKISGALNALNQQYNSYGTACRLAKRWIASQLNSLYFDDIAIELIMAYIYINSAPFTTPNSPITAFLRFLSTLADHNWKISPLIVNLNNQMTDEMMAEIQSKFTTQRPTLPPMFIASPYDPKLSIWTKCSPTPIILNRVTHLASAAKNTLVSQLRSPRTSDFKLIFRPEMNVYDAVIHLNSQQITNSIQAIDFPFKYKFLIHKFSDELNRKMPVIDFDPINSYLSKLRATYEEFALFFYDTFGGKEIAVLFKPNALQSRSFKVSHINGFMLSSTANKDGTQHMDVNIEAIIEDFRILGHGIVESVETRSENFTF